MSVLLSRFVPRVVSKIDKETLIGLDVITDSEYVALR